MNPTLFRRIVAANAIRVGACALGLLVWGAALPLIYASFGRVMADFLQGNPLLKQFSQFGGGDLFSLHGAIALGLVHPFSILLLGIVAIGYPGTAIAGERQRGTLEVLLAKPVSRRTVYLTSWIAGAVFLALLLALELGMNVASSIVTGVGPDLAIGNVPLVWLNAWVLFLAFMSIAFAASVSFDRLPPALGVPLAIVLVFYLADAVGSIWPDAAWLRDWSLFDLVKTQRILGEGGLSSDLLVLLAIVVATMGYALVRFPRRDLAAPS